MWRYIYKKAFLKDLSKIHLKKTRENIEKLVFEQIPDLKNPSKLFLFLKEKV